MGCETLACISYRTNVRSRWLLESLRNTWLATEKSRPECLILMMVLSVLLLNFLLMSSWDFIGPVALAPAELLGEKTGRDFSAKIRFLQGVRGALLGKESGSFC